MKEIYTIFIYCRRWQWQEIEQIRFFLCPSPSLLPPAAPYRLWIIISEQLERANLPDFGILLILFLDWIFHPLDIAIAHPPICVRTNKTWAEFQLILRAIYQIGKLLLFLNLDSDNSP